MSEYWGWLGRAGYTKKAIGREGIVLLYDDCFVWTVEKTAPATTAERERLSPEDALALDEHNWLVRLDQIVGAYAFDFFAGAGPYARGSHYTRFEVHLPDGTRRQLNMRRREKTDTVAGDLLQEWLGDRLSWRKPPVGPTPPGLKGKLVRAWRKLD